MGSDIINTTQDNKTDKKILYSVNLISLFSKIYLAHICWFCSVVYLFITLIKNGDYKILIFLVLFSALTTLLDLFFKSTVGLREKLYDANTTISILKKENYDLEKSRQALSNMVITHKDRANKAESAYSTAKLGITGIIRSHRVTKDKEAMLKLFEDIENKYGKDAKK